MLISCQPRTEHRLRTAGFIPSDSLKEISYCDIKHIVAENCIKCHRPDGFAPFSLLKSSALQSRKSTVFHVLKNNIMPPWRPDPTYRHFLGENVLTAGQRDSLLNWLHYGAKGCSNDSIEYDSLRVPHSYTKWKADIAIGVPYAHTINTMGDSYHCYIIPVGNKDIYAKGIQILPGNRKVVHHASAYFIDDPKHIEEIKKIEDLKNCNCDSATDQYAKIIANYTRGSISYIMPGNIRTHLKANTYMALVMHYASGYKGETDSTVMNIVTEEINKPYREVMYEYVNKLDIEFKPGEKKTETLTIPITKDISIISVWPHTHTLARNVLSYAVTPSNDTIPLIRIKDWDYFWQGLYLFPQPVHIPKGSNIIMSVRYDNTAGNPNNANSPPVLVRYGSYANQEMFVFTYQYMDYINGDEDIYLGHY